MIQSSRNRFLFVLLATMTILIVIALKLGGAGTSTVSGARGTWVQSRASQLIFFAVLEGLYRDGVSNDDVDLIIPLNPKGQGRFDPDHFVYACPLCHPAFEAFRVYRQREPFFGLKARLDTLGPGLDNSVTLRLRSTNADERRQAIEELINRWVRQRLELMRLSSDERETINREMEQGRKQGMNGLKQTTQTRTNCPICDGSFGATKIPER